MPTANNGSGLRSKSRAMLRHLARLLVLAATLLAANAMPAQGLHFGVLNQRSPQLTAQHWNPTLDLIGQKPPLRLVATPNRDDDSNRSFYRTTLVRPPAI